MAKIIDNRKSYTSCENTVTYYLSNIESETAYTSNEGITIILSN